MSAEILSWSRAKGLFAGVALKGATLRPDEDANREAATTTAAGFTQSVYPLLREQLPR